MAARRLLSGLRPADRTFESWWVRPGARTVVELHAGDRMTVIDPDGGQPAELTVLAPDGREDPAPSARRRRAGVGAARPARNGGDDGFLRVLHARGLRPHDARALRLFGHEARRARRSRSKSARRAGDRRCARRPGRGRRAARIGARRRAEARDAASRGGDRAAAAARRAAARLPGRQGQRPRLRGEGGRVHPDHRRRRASSARTSSPSTARSSRGGSSAASTASPPAR